MQQSSIQEARLRNIRNTRGEEDGREGEKWRKNGVEAAKQVTNKPPIREVAAKKTAALSKKRGVSGTAAIGAINAGTNDEDGDYLPPAIRLAIKTRYSPEEDAVFEFCRPAPVPQEADNPHVFAGWAEGLSKRLNDPHLERLLHEELLTREMVNDYRGAVVFETR